MLGAQTIFIEKHWIKCEKNFKLFILSRMQESLIKVQLIVQLNSLRCP